MAARNRRAPASEPDAEEANKKERAIRIEKITAKIHALIWMLLAGLLAYFTDLFTLIFSDKLNR
ncbi:hypothetical protein EON65_04360 [archaeon]|nr:MAG: hypothetical protein EON65_04360 [archaeon]